MASLNVLVKLLSSSTFRLSSLAFAASFLPPVFISIFLNFLGYARVKYLALQPRFYRLPGVRQLVRHSVWSHIFLRSVFPVLFPFCLQYFRSHIHWLYLFSIPSLLLFFCSCSRDFSLTRESNSLSDYRRVRLLSLEPRLFLYRPHSTTLSFRLQCPSFSIYPSGSF